MGGSITDVPGVLLGHEQDLMRGSGITVLLFPRGAAGGADIRGGGAGAGVMRLLEERGVGSPTPAGVVPIVPTAVIYDLGFGDPTFRPTPEMAYTAAKKASGQPPESGSVGAGAGATRGES